MELKGFYYDNSAEKIDANGYPIPQYLVDQGYSQRNDANGYPRWYVPRIKVIVIVDENGVERKFDIYNNIMALYPERKMISLKLVHEVIKMIIEGDILIVRVEGKPFLWKVKKPAKGRKKRRS